MIFFYYTQITAKGMNTNMKRIETIMQMIECGVVAVIRAETKEQGVKIVNAVKNGGI